MWLKSEMMNMLWRNSTPQQWQRNAADAWAVTSKESRDDDEDEVDLAIGVWFFRQSEKRPKYLLCLQVPPDVGPRLASDSFFFVEFDIELRLLNFARIRQNDMSGIKPHHKDWHWTASMLLTHFSKPDWYQATSRRLALNLVNAWNVFRAAG